MAILLYCWLPGHAQNFEVNAIHCSMSDDNVATMNKIGKYEGHFYNVIFNTEMNDTLTVHINLYGRKGEFNKIQRQDLHGTFTDGFFTSLENRIYMYKTDDYLNVILHESSHAMLSHNLRNPPRWLDEGIATLFGRMVIGNKGEVFYVKQPRYISLLKKAVSDRTFNLENYLHYDIRDWYDTSKREYMYTVAYCLVYYFAETNIEELQHFMLNLKEGHSVAATIKKLYGGLPQFENKFLNFIGTQSAFNGE